MSKHNIQTLKGFRDFLPTEKRLRDYVAAKIKTTFARYGFEPIETPTLEYAELLLGKYGDEADKLIYTFTDKGNRRVGLRYDQTVPTARVLTQYQNKLGKGFRRYQIQNVFRADKPQKGRYREFTQCDADIFGSQDNLADAEILAVFYAIYQDLGIKNLKIALNDRTTLYNTLTPFATNISVPQIIQSIDKLDKLSAEEVTTELIAKGLDYQTATKALSAVKEAKPSTMLKDITQKAIALGVPADCLVFTPTLARGLDYYTGLIFESKLNGIGASLGGGGRYDHLIASLGGPSIPAVGFGLGFDRTIEVALAQNLLPNLTSTAKVLVCLFSQDLQELSLQTAQKLRQAKINTELYVDSGDKLTKQLKYADQKNIPYAIIIGEEEAKNNTCILKDLSTHTQQTLSLDEIIKLLSKKSQCLT